MPSNLQPILFLVAIALVFYLLMIRPQQKKRKETQAMLQALKPGSEIVTTAGMYGKVVALEGDDALLIEVAPGVTCRYMRQAVMRVVPEATPAAAEPATLAESTDEKSDKTDADAESKDDAKTDAKADAASTDGTATESDGADDATKADAAEASDDAKSAESKSADGDRKTSS